MNAVPGAHRQIAEVAHELEADRGAVQELLDGARGRVDALVRSGLVADSSAGAFSQRYAQLTISIDDACRSLSAMAHFLTGTANALSDSEQLAAAVPPAHPHHEETRR